MTSEAARWVIGPRSFRRLMPAVGWLGPLGVRPADARLRRPGRRHPRRRRHDGRARSPRSTVPTLVVVGNQDILTPRGDSEELAELIPTAELVVISGAAHGLMVEHASTFNRVLLDFLRSRRAVLAGPGRRSRSAEITTSPPADCYVHQRSGRKPCHRRGWKRSRGCRRCRPGSARCSSCSTSVIGKYRQKMGVMESAVADHRALPRRRSAVACYCASSVAARRPKYQAADGPRRDPETLIAEPIPVDPGIGGPTGDPTDVPEECAVRATSGWAISSDSVAQGGSPWMKVSPERALPAAAVGRDGQPERPGRHLHRRGHAAGA